MAEILLSASVPLAIAALFVVLIWIAQYFLSGRVVHWHQNIVLYPWPLVASLLLMAAGILATVIHANGARQAAYDEAQNRFMHQAELVDSDLQEQMADLIQLLHGVRGLFLTQRHIQRSEFQNFVTTNDLHRGFMGARGLGYVERVRRAALPGFVVAQRAAGWPDFRVKSAGDAPELFIVKAIEPSEANQGALGNDLGFEPVRRAAAEAAMLSGRQVLSQRIALIQDVLKRPSFLLMQPVYANKEVPVETAERQRSLRGWAYAPLVFSELLSTGPMSAERLVSFQLFDGPELSAKTLVYDSELPSGEIQSPDSLTRYTHSAFSVVRPVLLVDKVFYLRASSTPEFERSYQPEAALQTAMQGSGLSVMMAMVLWLLMVGRARALHLAHGMTQDLERLAAVARRTSNAVYFADTGWNITWVNEGFTRMCGYVPEEAIGRTPGSLLHSPLTDPAVIQKLDAAAYAGQHVNVQVQQRSKDGRDYWAEVEVVPVRARSGVLTGYLSVQSDITEEVRAKTALLLEKERAQNILSGTNVGTWESNLLTGEQHWNERWNGMMGFTREEVLPDLDAFWQKRVHPADLERLDRALADCISGLSEGYSCDVRALRKDGSWMWILSRAKVMSRSRDGHVEWIGGIHTDITDIKKVELELREMESFLDRAGRIAGVGAWQVDFKTRELTFSAQTCVIHGMAPGFKPTMEVALSFYPEVEQQRLVEAMERAEQHGESWDLVVEFHNAQGEQRWVRIYAEVGFDDSGPVRLVGAFQDVTKDHLAQVELERSGALLRGAIEAINEAFVLYDPQDRLVFCNDKYKAIYGRTADLMEPGVSFEALLRAGAERGQYAEAIENVEAWVAQRMAAHRQGNVTMEQRLEDGRWLKILERRMPDGHMVGFRVDITELKQATAAAESISAQRGEEQRRLQSILEGTHVGTWEWNVQTGKSYYNDQYVGMLGYTLQELEPLDYETWKRLVHPDDLKAASRHMERHLRGDSDAYAVEIRMQHKLGHWMWVLAKGKLAVRTQDGQPLWVYGTHMDVTERKLAEQRLAQTSATLQNVLDSATAVGVMTQGLDKQLQVFNKGAELLLGYQASDVVGQADTSAFFEPSEVQALRDKLAGETGREPLLEEVFDYVSGLREPQEWTLVRKDGSRFQASLIYSALRDAQGQWVGNLAVVSDISKQKEYESSLREAMRLAEQSSVSKSQFLANMSHEIRTPMNAILGMLQLLRNTALDTSQRDYAEKASGAARSLLGLLNDILDFSKVEAGKMQLNPEPFVLEELLGDLSVILSSNLGGKNVDLLFDVDPALPRALIGDAMRLKQILINLGGNAVKFTEQGQVVMRWTQRERSPGKVLVEVAVSDTGIGIAPENQARIFNAFTQAEANTTRRFGGTGLGLVISTRLIRLMGGELALQSALGQGSTFSFTLELAVADEVGSHADRTAAGGGAGTEVRNVLLVDDNPAALASSASMMRSLGWQVQEAATAEQALALLGEVRTTPLDAVFVDDHMPGSDGWDMLRKVRRLFAKRAPPKLILLSRHSRDALSQRTDREQELLDGLLVKPLTASMFVQSLEKARTAAGASRPVEAKPQRLEGMRVLLVEDNAINQQVAQELLAAEGAQIQLADNGALGLDALRTAPVPFHVVLMDLQMPVMDGLTATRQLRLDPRFTSLPVIAMTANAMGSDREECLQAGMNDHVGKPFDLNQLVQTLIFHTHWAGSENGLSIAAVRPSAPPSASAIDVDLALHRMGGNAVLLQRSVASYISDARKLPARLLQLLQTSDPGGFKRELHAFKGLSATVGAQALSHLAAQLEKDSQNPSTAPDLTQAVERLQESVDRYLPELEAAVAKLVDQQPASVTDTAPVVMTGGSFVKQMRGLLAALRASDMGAMELHATLHHNLGPDHASLMQDLDAAMANLDFEAAARACVHCLTEFDASTL